MFALSSYSSETEAALREDLNRKFAGKGEEHGIFAKLLSKYRFVQFDWPDWPIHRSRKSTDLVNQFHATHRDLRAVMEGCDEWNAVFSGLVSDSHSAAEIGKRFERHFGERAAWVRCQKNGKGRVR